jgi:SAM-dependent methyltransferase
MSIQRAVARRIPGARPLAAAIRRRGSPAITHVDRRDVILGEMTRSMRILEIGPGYNPIAPRADGWNVATVDHAPRDALVEKYRGDPSVDISRIENVDVVWGSGSLAAAVPTALHGTFDACIASHVVEHIPDVIEFLASLAVLLNPTGFVSLALPDKRYCFDFFKPLTTTGDLLVAHSARASVHSRKARFEQVAYSSTRTGASTWDLTARGSVELMFTFDDALAALESIGNGPAETYVDCHAWYFTPSSFALLILELQALDLVSFRIERQAPPQGCEFYVALRRGRDPTVETSALDRRRRDLLLRCVSELGAQADSLPNGEP